MLLTKNILWGFWDENIHPMIAENIGFYIGLSSEQSHEDTSLLSVNPLFPIKVPPFARKDQQTWNARPRAVLEALCKLSPSRSTVHPLEQPDPVDRLPQKQQIGQNYTDERTSKATNSNPYRARRNQNKRLQDMVDCFTDNFDHQQAI